MISTENNFKEFVDNHVQATTKLKAADELLNKGKPFTFIWICLSVFSVLGFVIGGPIGLLVFGGLFGYVTAYITGRIKYFNLWRRSYPPVTTEVNTDELVRFLNENLLYLSPYFSEWESIDDKTVKCKFNKKIDAVIVFDSIPEEDRRFFKISARKAKVMNYVAVSGSGFSAGKTNAGFGEYSCLYKSAPILGAAVEYYLKGIGV